jgi:hypothetical protein
MLYPLASENYCYKISIFLLETNHPPKTSTCVSLASVQPDDTEIKLQWLDSDTLRVDLGDFETIEVDASIYIESTWRRVLPESAL